jgi:hypothetical protein
MLGGAGSLSPRGKRSLSDRGSLSRKMANGLTAAQKQTFLESRSIAGLRQLRLSPNKAER